jgi:hypothetical protein
MEEKKSISKKLMMNKSFSEKFHQTASSNSIPPCNAFTIHLFKLLTKKTGDSVTKKALLISTLRPKNSPKNVMIPLKLFLQEQTYSPWIQKRWPNFQETVPAITKKNFSISKENSINGFNKLTNYWMMTVIPEKNLLMLDQKVNLTTGETECKKLQAGLNNWRVKISNLLETTFSNTNNMNQEPDLEEMKTFQN